MSLKDQVNSMRVIMTSKACHHGYEPTQVIPVLYNYIAELEAQLAKPKPAPKKAPAKKAPAKKAPAKKRAAAKKKA